MQARGGATGKKKPIVVVVAMTAAVVGLAGAGHALGGGGGVIWGDGHAVQPGALGQVDLFERDGRVMYVVDVGDREVSVYARTGAIAGIGPQS